MWHVQSYVLELWRGRPSSSGCRVGPSVAAAGVHREACGGRRLAAPLDGWWRGGMGACGVHMLAGVCAVPVGHVRVVVVLCAVNGARAGGGGPASGDRSLAGVLRLVEQEFEAVGLICGA